jgi:hypothetical protein
MSRGRGGDIFLLILVDEVAVIAVPAPAFSKERAVLSLVLIEGLGDAPDVPKRGNSLPLGNATAVATGGRRCSQILKG